MPHAFTADSRASKILISYRRRDAKAIATLIYNPLAKYFDGKYGKGAVFMDVHGIPKGFDFHDYLNEQVANINVLIALIADRWLTAPDERGHRRLDNADDFVRIEIEAALARKIPIIPVYVDGVRPLRPADLPESLKPLARRNGAFLDTGVDFEVHIERLIHDIEPYLDGRYSPTQGLAGVGAKQAHLPSESEAERPLGVRDPLTTSASEALDGVAIERPKKQGFLMELWLDLAFGRKD